jgi:LysR family transcriptional regulator, regulator for bpeEF and oprC
MKLPLDLNRTYFFLKIIEAGNISKAAALLHEPKAKLSRHLALLEEELGVQLVYRTTRQFKLTEAGRIYYQSSKEHMEALVQASLSLNKEGEEISGLLKITAPDDIGLHVVSKIIHEFAGIYPKVSFELQFTNEVLDLVKLGIDVAFRVGHFKDSTLIQKKVATVPFLVASSRKYLEKRPVLHDVDKLSSHETLGLISGQASGWRLHSKNKKKLVKLEHKILANNFMVIKDLVKEGHGIGYLPKFLCRNELNNGEVVQILKQWGDEGAPLQLVVPSQRKISPKVRSFMDFAAKKCQEYV